MQDQDVRLCDLARRFCSVEETALALELQELQEAHEVGRSREVTGPALPVPLVTWTCCSFRWTDVQNRGVHQEACDDRHRHCRSDCGDPISEFHCMLRHDAVPLAAGAVWVLG